MTVAANDTDNVPCVFYCNMAALNIVHTYRSFSGCLSYRVHKCFYDRASSHAVSRTCATLVFTAI
jgi:hypothetical protein